MAGPFYNTIGVSGAQLRVYEQQAEKQKQRVLDFFKANPGKLISPEDVGRFVLPNTPRTSWGRCLTDLTSEGHLIKTGHMVIGQWKKPIHLWKLRDGEENQGDLF